MKRRISRRVAARRRAARVARLRRYRRAAVAVAIVAALGSGGWALSRSSLFVVQHIEVVGNAILSDAEVIAAAGIPEGTNALAADLDAAEERLRAVAAIGEAQVERSGALGIRIRIVERAPAVEIRAASGRWFLDREGHAIDAPRAGASSIPVIETAWAGQGPPPLPAGEVRAVLAVWDALPEEMRARVAAFEHSSAVVFRLGTVRVIFGAAVRIPDKLDAVRMVLARARRDGRRVLQVDVRAPDRPAARVV